MKTTATTSSARRGPVALLGTGLVIAVVTTACGSSSSATGGGASPGTSAGVTSMTMAATSAATSAAPSGGTTVAVKNFSFSPMALTVAVGTKVTWTFDDTADHTVKASDGSFTSPPLSNGKTYSHTFTKAGTFAYICSIHQYMAGTIIVK